jgi:hypothetical protein
MSYLKDREIWLSSVPTSNPPAGYVWVFIQNGVFVVRDSNGVDKIMASTTGTVTNATSASYVEYSNVADKPALISGSSQVSYTGLSDIPTGIVSSSAQIGEYGVFATTGSNQFNGSQAITGSLTVTGQVIAQTLNVQQVTSSIVYSSGSNVFGNSLDNTQQFTGSMSVTGSLTVNGTGTFASSVTAGNNLLINNLAASKKGYTYQSPASNWGPQVSGLYFTPNNAVDAQTTFTVELWNGLGSIITPLSIASTGAATFSSSVTATQYTATSTGGNGLRVYGASGTNQWDIYLNSTNLRFSDNTGTGNIVFDRPLNGTSATFNGNLNLQGAVTRNINFYDSSNTNINAQIQYDQISSTSGQLFFGTNNAGTFATRLTISNTGAATFSSSVTATTLTLSATTADYAATITNVQDSSQGLLVRATDNDSSLYLLNLQSSGGATSQTWIDRFAVTKQGNVGINDTNPASLLSIQRGASGDNMELIGSGESGYSDILFYNTSKAARLGYIDWSNTQARWNVEANIPLVLYTNATERMRITPEGNIRLFITPAIDTNIEWFQTPANVVQAKIWADGNPRFNVQVGGSGGVYLSSGATSWTGNSDERLKTINSNIENAVEKINTLRSVNFSWKSDPLNKENLGLIAQDIQAVFPQIVDTDKDGLMGVRYTELIPVLVKAIQELKSENDNLKSRLEVLEQA